MISRFNNITQANIQTSPRRYNEKQSSSPNFKGPVDLAVQGGTQVLNFLNTSPAVGAIFVDFGSMVLPRTLVDFSRSKDAGMETGFRESSGTFNHALAGIVGLGAGYGVSSAFNKANGVKAHLMYADGITIDSLSEFVKASHTDTGYNSKTYWTSILENLEGLNTTDGENVWKKLKEANPEKFNEAVELLSKEDPKKYKTPANIMKKVKEIFTCETGAASTYRLKGLKNDAGYIEGSLENIISNAYAMRKTIVDKLTKLSKDAKKEVHVIEDFEKFIKGIKNRKVVTVAAGLAVPVAIGMSTQPLNRYLTKKRTGSDGFVGVEGREPDKSAGFKIGKIALGLGMGSLMISTILKNPMQLYTNIKKAGPEILSKLQYKGMVPTIDQFKFIYGMTIMSRIFAARDKNEMRESGIKDSLGFLNWLILGGFVSKLAAKAFNKGTMNYNEALHGKNLWNFITKGVEKTHEEMLYPTLKKMGISIFNEEGKALPFRKLMSTMAKKAKGTEFEAIAKETASKLKYKNYAQLLGYIYSGVVLGYGIPKLNIAITKHIEGKKKKKNGLQNDKMKVSVNTNTQIIKPESKTFSAFGAFLK